MFLSLSLSLFATSLYRVILQYCNSYQSVQANIAGDIIFLQISRTCERRLFYNNNLIRVCSRQTNPSSRESMAMCVCVCVYVCAVEKEEQV